jgi:hypothetical protein
MTLQLKFIQTFVYSLKRQISKDSEHSQYFLCWECVTQFPIKALPRDVALEVAHDRRTLDDLVRLDFL